MVWKCDSKPRTPDLSQAPWRLLGLLETYRIETVTAQVSHGEGTGLLAESGTDQSLTR